MWIFLAGMLLNSEVSLTLYEGAFESNIYYDCILTHGPWSFHCLATIQGSSRDHAGFLHLQMENKMDYSAVFLI